ncbi:MAG: transcriptional regulator [Paenibacillaceae bacterium]|nr:transcriptional regulator [Paenibacillaceae bacterium]
MRRLFKFNTIYHNLLVSYAALTIIAITALGASSYLYFSSNFNEQIEKVNVRMLHHLSDMIDNNAIRRAEELYVEMVMDLPRNNDVLILFDQPLEGNHSKLLEIQRYLTQLAVNNDDLVDSINIYYRQLGVLVSSGAQGFTLLQADGTPGSSWMNRMLQNNSNTLWLQQSLADEGGNGGTTIEALTFVRAYPFTAKADKAKGFISIHLKPDAITRYLEPQSSTDRSSFLLLDHEGNLMEKSIGDSRLTGEHLESLTDRLEDMDEAEGNFLGDYGTRLIASYTTIGENGWRLVNLTPVDQYYEKSRTIRNTFLLLCLVAVAFGIILSNLFSLRIYNPVNSLMGRIRSSAGLSLPPDKEENELQTIDRVFNHLNLKVSELEQTFADNMPLIKHHLITGLMQGSISGQEEMQDMLRLLGLSWTGSRYTAMIIQLDPDQMSALSQENSQFIPYNLISRIEGDSAQEAAFLGTALPQYQVEVLIAADRPNTGLLVQTALGIIGYVHDQYRLSAKIAYGSWESSPLRLHQCHSEAAAALAYQYFFPNSPVLSGPELMKRESSKEEIDPDSIREFSRLLKTGRPEQVQAFVHEWIAALQEGPYSAEHGQQRIRELVDAFRTYLQDLHIPYRELFGAGSWDHFRRVRHIHQMEDWLLLSVDTAFEYLKDKQKNRSKDILEELRQYVQELYRTDISLDSAAEHVSLSPRYVSKIFKDETGVNFTDYVTQVRLNHAVELIMDTSDTVEQISRQAGFNSSGYFIRKFKEQYGVTPGVYKSIQGDGAPGSKNDRDGKVLGPE